jgi:hypothetical protein
MPPIYSYINDFDMFIETIKETDINTGEVIETKKIVAIKKITGDSFLQMYTDNLLYFLEIEPASVRKIAGLLFVEARFDQGWVDIGSYVKKHICETLGITLQTFRNGLKVLLDKKILIHKEGDRYYINPDIAWKGSLQSKQRLLEAEAIKLSIEPVYKAELEALYKNQD